MVPSKFLSTIPPIVNETVPFLRGFHFHLMDGPLQHQVFPPWISGTMKWGKSCGEALLIRLLLVLWLLQAGPQGWPALQLTGVVQLQHWNPVGGWVIAARLEARKSPPALDSLTVTDAAGKLDLVRLGVITSHRLGCLAYLLSGHHRYFGRARNYVATDEARLWYRFQALSCGHARLRGISVSHSSSSCPRELEFFRERCAIRTVGLGNPTSSPCRYPR